MQEFIKENWEKYFFPLGKLGFWTYWEFCRIFDIGMALNIYVNYLMFYPSRQHVTALRVYKFTFNNDFLMNSFIVTRSDFGHVFIWWWVTLFLAISYFGLVVKVNFSSINFDMLLKIVSFPASWVMAYIMKMYCSYN